MKEVGKCYYCGGEAKKKVVYYTAQSKLDMGLSTEYYGVEEQTGWICSKCRFKKYRKRLIVYGVLCAVAILLYIFGHNQFSYNLDFAVSVSIVLFPLLALLDFIICLSEFNPADKIIRTEREKNPNTIYLNEDEANRMKRK